MDNSIIRPILELRAMLQMHNIPCIDQISVNICVRCQYDISTSTHIRYEGRMLSVAGMWVNTFPPGFGTMSCIICEGRNN